jgi:hypothetical protein
MTHDEIKARFTDEIKLRGYEDRYIDRNEEREILQIAIQLGVNIDAARTDLAEVCTTEGYVLETAVLKLIREQVEAAAANDGRIDWAEFDLILANARAAVSGKRTDRQVKTLLVQVMEDTGNNRVRRGWFTNWYAAVKKELGIV